MIAEQISVLLVEDNPGDARLLREAVKEAEGIHIELTHDATLQRGLLRVGQQRFDVIMLDLSLPDAEGLDTLVRMHQQAPTVPIVVLTGLDDEALAVRAVREGAQDYLVKGQVTGQILVRAMRYATERKRAVEALQRSEEYFRSLIENALDIITVIDDDGVINYASPSMERVLGIPHATLTGTNILARVHPNDLETVHAKLDTSRKDPTVPQFFEFTIRHVDGTWRVLEAIGKRFDGVSGKEGFVLNSRDITERKRAEAEVRQANQTVQAVIEMSPLAIYSTDLHGIVRHWNTAAERVLGYPAGEVIGRSLPGIFPATAEVKVPSEAAAEGPMLPTYEGPCLRKDDSTAEVTIWETNLRDTTGAISGVVAIVADNTERKKLEEQIRQSQKMEAVGRLAGGIAHDFNNLLTVITGYCQMLVDSLAAEDPVRGDMAQVLKAADRATTLTKQLLAFSRQQIVQPKVIDLNHLISEMEHILRRLVGEDVELSFQRTSEPLKVRVDPGQLEQVIVNLAVNARDAMPRGGRLTLQTSSVDVPDDADKRSGPLLPGSHVLLRVKDTGVGMDPITKSHLFEPFFTTKEKGRGTGLGLSTSYGIIKQNQGEIEVDSEPGAGSSFMIYLPRVYEPVSAELPREQTRRRQGGTETIMVVEDEDGVRKVVVEMLQQQGYNVLPANSGPAALELYKSATDSVHLLITDVIMPRMSGRQLADSLREVRPDLKVLFVSGYTDSAIVHHGVLDSGTHFLQKPFTPDVLAEKVRSLLEG